MNIQNICIRDTTLLNSAKTFGNFDLELTLPKAILPSIRSSTAHYICWRTLKPITGRSAPLHRKTASIIILD